MKRFKNAIFVTFLFLALATILLYAFDFDYIFKGIRTTFLEGHTSAYINDYTEFDNRVIETGEPQPWPLHQEYNKIKPTRGLLKINDELNTVAFLIIKNDSIWFENYSEAYGKDSKTNSFSMAKSIVAALLGRAIMEGHIKSLQQPVADFFPQFDPALTVGDLASMASGLNWEESYTNPFSMTIRAYLDDNLRKQILALEVEKPPGKRFEYLSGNTILLGMVIEKAAGKTLSEYLSEEFWTPLGMDGDALWQLDSQESGMEKAFCCIASSARNFARFGKLYKNYGEWDGEQLLDSSFVAKSIRPRFKESPYYGYGFWLENYKDKEIFYMRGILGQYVIVLPEDDLIIVRLGEENGKKLRDEEYRLSHDFYTYLEEAYEMLGKKL